MKKMIFFYSGIIILMIIITLLSFFTTGGIFREEIRDEIIVYIKDEDKMQKMKREEYIKGVIAAEMPVEFEKEALKAQAVAARTYLMKKMQAENKDAHKGADVCTDHTCCQAWISEEKRKESWEAEKKDEFWNKICEAVFETEGEILEYDNKIISAVFHSSSSGKTEAAEDVWGENVPYLVSVESGWDEQSPKFYGEKQMPIADFKKILSEKYPDADMEKTLFDNIVRSETGGIKTIDVLGINMKGLELRKLLDLKSHNMEFFINEESVLIKTKGYGHGVGMSQYGANFMAQDGKNYKDILMHYYKGAEIVKKNNPT